MLFGRIEIFAQTLYINRYMKMKIINRKIRNNDFIKGLVIGIIVGMVLCPLKKGLITVNSYNENNSDCQNAINNQKKKPKNEKE